MIRRTKAAFIVPVVASLVLSTVSAGFAEPEQDSAAPEPAVANDQVVVTLQVVRPKDNPSDIRLIDYSPSQAVPAPAPAPVQAAPAPQLPAPVPAQPEVKPAEQSPKTVAEAPRPVEPAAEPKPAKPAPAAKKPTAAVKPVSPAPRTALAKPKVAPKPKSPAPKVKATPKPNPQKQSIISRAVKSATGLVSRAMSWIGTRYIWGGLSKAGVDCSGLTRMIYKSVGVHLPHNARQQFKLGRAVAKSSLAPGDLVFFNTSGPLSHVGIYVGNNKFVHAANPRRGVRTDSLGSSYYYKRYAGARRYI